VIAICPRQPQHLQDVSHLLLSAGLPTDGLATTQGWIACDHDQILGHIAIDAFADAIVIRSLVVAPESRSKGIASMLFSAAEEAASNRKIFLRTRTIADWVMRRGYVAVERSACPPSILASVEFSTSICASVAIYMRQ